MHRWKALLRRLARRARPSLAVHSAAGAAASGRNLARAAREGEGILARCILAGRLLAGRLLANCTYAEQTSSLG